MLLGSKVTVNHNRRLKMKPIAKEYMNAILLNTNKQQSINGFIGIITIN